MRNALRVRHYSLKTEKAYIGWIKEFIYKISGRLVKAAGGYWNRKRKLWELPYSEVIALGLEERIAL